MQYAARTSSTKRMVQVVAAPPDVIRRAAAPRSITEQHPHHLSLGHAHNGYSHLLRTRSGLPNAFNDLGCGGPRLADCDCDVGVIASAIVSRPDLTAGAGSPLVAQLCLIFLAISSVGSLLARTALK